MHTIKMPKAGLYRAGRWGDVDTYPAPAPMIWLGQPQEDGFRWEDAFGVFATANCSASEHAAIGRTIARYRRAVDSEGRSVAEAIKDFMSGPPDDGEPDLVDGVVPTGVFDDLYSIHIPADESIDFVDLEHDDTRKILVEQLDGVLHSLGLGPLCESLTREKDRRVTRLAMSAIYNLSMDGRYGAVAGIRCAGEPDRSWDTFVLWSPPERVTLAADDVKLRWIARWDEDLETAAEILDVHLPPADDAHIPRAGRR